MGANVGATRANDLPRQRTNADKRVAIMPGRELIRTMLNATQVTTDQQAGVRIRPSAGCDVSRHRNGPEPIVSGFGVLGSWWAVWVCRWAGSPCWGRG
jgi:hypothetical protein